jgi:hypothetical protein
VEEKWKNSGRKVGKKWKKSGRVVEEKWKNSDGGACVERGSREETASENWNAV